jgi:hypothetical protein
MFVTENNLFLWPFLNTQQHLILVSFYLEELTFDFALASPLHTGGGGRWRRRTAVVHGARGGRCTVAGGGGWWACTAV